MARTEERKALWGMETEKAIANFPVSGEPIPLPVARWLGRIKAAAARSNADLGLLDADMAERIASAADRVAAGEFDDQFPIDVFPSAVHLAALQELTEELVPALELLAASLERKSAEFADVVKSGRTHLMDAVPVTLGQEFGGYAAQVRQGIARIRDALPR